MMEGSGEVRQRLPGLRLEFRVPAVLVNPG